MKLLMKFLHEVGSYGLVAAFTVQLLILAQGEPDGRSQLELVGQWVALPSLLVVLVSGFLAMLLRPVFFRKEWVWIKVFLTMPSVYATVATLPGVGSFGSRAESTLWLALVTSIIVTAYSVFRPKGIVLE